MFKNYAHVDSPVTEAGWIKMSTTERLHLINQKISENDEFAVINPTDSSENGQVLVDFKEEVSAAKRGVLLLSFEALLKDSIDQGINVWHKPIDDKNKLRQFRGIVVKS